MYIWNLSKLKADLAGPGLTAAQELACLVPLLCVLAATFVSVPEHNEWSAVYGGLVVLTIVLGSVHAYRCNGGAAGRDFASRYLVLAWVCGVRFALCLVVPVTVMMVVVPGSPWKLAWPGEQPPLAPFDVAIRLICVPPLFWMIGRNLRDVAAATVESPDEAVLDPVGVGLEPLED